MYKEHLFVDRVCEYVVNGLGAFRPSNVRIYFLSLHFRLNFGVAPEPRCAGFHLNMMRLGVRSETFPRNNRLVNHGNWAAGCRCVHVSHYADTYCLPTGVTEEPLRFSIKCEANFSLCLLFE